MKITLLKVSCLTLLGMLSLQTYGGALVDVNYETDVQFFQTKGEITGCGIGFVGIEKVDHQSRPVRLVSGSMVLSTNDGKVAGITKVGMATFKYDPSKAQQPAAPLSQVTDYWMRRTGGKIVNSKNKTISQSKSSILQVISVDDFADLFKSINSENEFQVGVSAKKENNELIFAGNLKVSDNGLKRLEDCMKNLFEEK